MSKPTSFQPSVRPPSMSPRPVPSNAFPSGIPSVTVRAPSTPSMMRGPATPTVGLKPAATQSATMQPPPLSVTPFIIQPSTSRYLDRDMTLPLDLKLPEFDVYRRLVEIDAKMDYYLNRAHMKLQQAVLDPQRSIYTSPRILRFTVANTHEGQPFVDGVAMPMGTKEPSWSIRLSGRLLDVQGNVVTGTGIKKMSSFFKQIVVQLDRSEFPTQWNITWNRARSADDVDTFTFTHKSSRESVVNIYLTLNGHPGAPEAFSPTPALREALGLTSPTYSREELLILMWRYIRTNDLQDLMRKSSVKCNEALKGIFDLEGFEYDDLPDLLQTQLLTPDPIHIPYHIKFCKDSKDAEVVVDIPVDVDNSPLPILNLNAHQAKINEVNRYTSEHIERINSKKRKRDFYLDFASDAPFFMQEWLQSQGRDIAVINKSTTGHSNSAERDNDALPTTLFQTPLADVAVRSVLAQNPSRIPQDIPFVENDGLVYEL